MLTIKNRLLNILLITALFFCFCNGAFATPHRPRQHASTDRKPTLVVEGLYKSEMLDGETESCDLSVRITKIKGRYRYVFHIGKTVKKGKVQLSAADGPGDKIITFEGITWAEYEGDVSNVKDEDRPVAMKLPAGITGLISKKDGITIQNSGNALNYYVQIAGCGQKYIHLVKQ